MPARLRPERALYALGALVAASTVARFTLSRGVEAPWIAPDEDLYGLLGRALVHGHGLTILGERVPYYSLLYPAFVGVPFLGRDLASGITMVQALQALLMSATAMPVFFWARPLAGSRAALLAAALTVSIPGLAYSGLLMSEALYLPVAVVACWALARCLCEPTAARQAVLLGAVGLALATRLQAIGFVPTILGALLVLAVAERSARTARRMLPTIAVVCGAAFAWIVARITTGGLGGSVGAYAPLAEAAHYSLGDVGSSIAQQAGAVALVTIGIPLVGLGVLTWSALRGREPDPGVRALVATTVAYVAVTVLEVGAFASRFVEHLTERQLLSVAPPVFIAFAVWLHRGLPRPQPSTSVIALGVAASALLLPVGSITARAAAVDALSTIPLEHLRRHLSEAGFQTVYALVAALLVLLAVVVPKRFGAALAGIVAVALLAASIVASREIRDRSRAERESSFAGAPPSWMDQNGAQDVGMLVTGELLWPGVWHQLFWNSSISGVVHLHGAALPGAAPQEEVSVARDGSLLRASGAPVGFRELATPSTITVAGTPVWALRPSADQPGVTLWRLAGPARVLQRITGLRPNGDLYGGTSARIEVFACRPGELQLTLLGKQGFRTRIRSGGRILAERAIPPQGVWRPSVPAPAGADGSGSCVFELQSDGLVGSTRIEFVPD
jgi:hypothetical protein